MIEISRAFGRDLLYGISRYSNIHGPWVFNTDMMFHGTYPLEKLPSKKSFINNIKKFNPDGIITREFDYIDSLIALGVPTIVSPLSQRKLSKVANIVSDDEAMGKMAAEYLLDRSFRHFAFCGFDEMHWSRKRYNGFKNRLAQAGFKVHLFKNPVIQQGQPRKSEQQLLVKWLVSLPKPIGLMTCIDERSQNVIEACKIAHVHVPDEIAIIGVDNDPLICGLASPQLSSVVLNGEVVGYQAAELLDKLMSGKKVTNKTITCKPTNVVTRLSTDTFAIEDKEVLRAVRFIRSNANKLIQVKNVVENSSLSRRRLEQRFKSILGHPINKEISRARADIISKMLVVTDISITDIATKLGYTSPEHIGRFFKKQRGMTPRNYRIKHRS